VLTEHGDNVFHLAVSAPRCRSPSPDHGVRETLRGLGRSRASLVDIPRLGPCRSLADSGCRGRDGTDRRAMPLDYARELTGVTRSPRANLHLGADLTGIGALVAFTAGANDGGSWSVTDPDDPPQRVLRRWRAGRARIPDDSLTARNRAGQCVLLRQKIEQERVELTGVRRGEPVRCTRQHFEPAPRDQLM